MPAHLIQFAVDQKYELYTAIDQASWRYIMRVSSAFFKNTAHPKYLDGLAKTGISTDRIPRIEEMDACLRKFGWRAVAVSGFIPPAVFLEFESLGILPIACDMRSLEHLAYTPAPDIVHEAAGHAPIIADKAYATYLKRYGEVAKKAIFSDQDMNVYEAIRHLSEVKENPTSTAKDIATAQKRLDEAMAAVTYNSEATLLSRMNWWTAEYGLIGSPKRPLIYGAGLLSSVGESYDCYKENVKKIPFTLDCINYSYDITKPQPQLFVTPSFATLNKVLDQLSAKMAFKKGGLESLQKAKQAKTVTTTQLDSGLQISGVVTDFFSDAKGNTTFVRLTGPVQLSYADKQLAGHDPGYHRQGFSSPVGLLKGSKKSAATLSSKDLQKLGFTKGKKGKMTFASGIELTGCLQKSLQKNKKNVVLTFDDCTITKGSEVLFDPSWGTFDLACGSKVVSVAGDAADRPAYLKAIGGHKQPARTMKTNLTDKNRELVELYAQVRKIRDSKARDLDQLSAIHQKLDERYAQDWLLRLEILELIREYGQEKAWESSLRRQLDKLALGSDTLQTLIDRGLALLENHH